MGRNPRTDSWCAPVLRIQLEEKETAKETEKIRSEIRKKPTESVANEIKGGKCTEEKGIINSVK